MDVQSIDKQTNNILNGTTDLSGFNQQEHAGICSAGPSLIGALIVCNHTRESLAASRNAAAGQAAGVSNWESDDAQEQAVRNGPKKKESGFLSPKNGSPDITVQRLPKALKQKSITAQGTHRSSRKEHQYTLHSDVPSKPLHSTIFCSPKP